MTDQIITAPWRDGTEAGEKSADLFNQTVGKVLEDAPASTQFIRDNGAYPYVDLTIDMDELQPQHLNYLITALSDEETLDNIDKTAARVREIMRVSV